MTTLSDWISLSLVPGLGPRGLRQLIDHFATPEGVLSASRKQLLKVQGIRERQVAGLCNPQHLRSLGHLELDRLKAMGAGAVCLVDPLYPERLRHLVDPPSVLYTLGDQTLLAEPSVAIVGSRAATEYGRRVAFSLAENMARRSLAVVSGLALGIDTRAHLGALHGGGKTIAVVGSGLDIVYPRQNLKLQEDIARTGLVVSEYPLGTPPDGFRFPARNRIIAGLSLGVVVVEAARRSGSLITAQIGLDIGREIFSVPGQIDSFKSEGTHWLLQQGAKLVRNGDDIVEELQAQYPLASPLLHGENKATGGMDGDMDGDTLALLKHIEPYPRSRDDLIEISGLPPARLSELLLFLELEGLIEMLPGDRLRRKEL